MSVELQALTRLTELVTADYLENYGLLPLELSPSRVTLGTWVTEVDPQALDDFRVEFSAEPVLVPLPEAEARAAIARLYADEATTASDVIAGLTSEAPATFDSDIPLDDLRHLANEAPVIKLVNLLVLEALEARASDVHLEAYADRLRVRYRIDGVLQEAPSPPAGMSTAIVSRLKIMADLDIAERRQPQDGRIRLRLQDRQVDVRVSTLPTLKGESVVLRLLDKEKGRVALGDLGMAADTLATFTEVVGRPHGIVLATGPTGSGKTTTLYAAIDLIRTGREKILTVEDPVEYQLAGVPQVAVNEKVGLTFASALRALLRQDPDVMLVGEIRDAETAEIATQAALTGHLVLSTLHTNDACGALTRLLDLGVAPYLVASTVEAVLAQRLVRRLCAHCAECAPVTAAVAGELGPALTAEVIPVAVGCSECRGTGYRGRLGIYELLVVNDQIRAALLRASSSATLRGLAIELGMQSLRSSGARLVNAGLTTADEVIQTTHA